MKENVDKLFKIFQKRKIRTSYMYILSYHKFCEKHFAWIL